MRRNLYRIGLIATLVLGLVPVAASAETYHYQFRGNSAHASFSNTDSTGCISTDVYVALYEQRFRQSPGQPQQDAALDVYIQQYDYCQNVYLFYGGGWVSPLPAQAFDASHSLQSASVTTTVEVSDWVSGTQASVSIDLDWTGVGETFRGTNRSQNISPHYKYISRSSGSIREAQVTGTILLGTTNLAAAGSSWAYLNSSQSGSLDISR